MQGASGQHSTAYDTTTDQLLPSQGEILPMTAYAALQSQHAIQAAVGRSLCGLYNLLGHVILVMC